MKKQDRFYVTPIFAGKNPKIETFFVIFKSCQIGLYSENRIKITVAKSWWSICWRKTISCSAGNYPNRVYVEQLPVPLFYPRISDNANGPTSGRVVELIKRRGKPNSIEVVDNFSLSCFAIIFQQNFYRNALINMMIFAFFKLDVACVLLNLFQGGRFSL